MNAKAVNKFHISAALRSWGIAAVVVVVLAGLLYWFDWNMLRSGAGWRCSRRFIRVSSWKTS
jgi:hypothetical protein